MSRYVLISGSVAFDTIMVFDGYFKDHILPERVHQINVSMLTPQLKRESGGCAANIAYNLLKVAAGGNIAIGPMLLGAARPVHILTPSTTVRRIVNMTALAVADANAAHE